jgi:F0F1-type ATP synthase membrane subunit b/b'
MASRASESVSSAADSARQAGSDLADRAREQFNRLSDQAVEKTHAAQRQFNSTLNDSPIALGLAVLAAGAIVGLSMPSTRVEQEYMGEARDQLFDRAKSKANEAAEKVQHIAEDTAESIKNVAGLAAKVSDAAS